ncbi:hypothetical protein M5689_001157 [Euphorbia peplus]|nr:hypothetical protein M5689_001157 [Euphorbia peplus]
MASQNYISLILVLAFSLSSINVTLGRQLQDLNPLPDMPSLPNPLKPDDSPIDLPDFSKIIPDIMKLMRDLSKLPADDFAKLPMAFATTVIPDYIKLLKDLPGPKLPTLLDPTPLGD